MIEGTSNARSGSHCQALNGRLSCGLPRFERHRNDQNADNYDGEQDPMMLT
jgi:hypothetical protein